MNDGFLRFLVLLAVFFIAFLAVFFMRKIQGGNSLMDILSGRSTEDGFESQNYTLRDKPSIGLKDVEILAAINRENASIVRAVVPSVAAAMASGTSAAAPAAPAVRRRSLREMAGSRTSESVMNSPFHHRGNWFIGCRSYSGSP